MIWHMVILKILKKRTIADKFLKDKAFKITSDQNYDEYQRELASMVYKFFDKKSQESGANNEIKQNIQLGDELHKPIIKNKIKKEQYIQDLKIIFGMLI